MKLVSVLVRSTYSCPDDQRLTNVEYIRTKLIAAGLINPNTPESTYAYQSYEVMMTADMYVDWLIDPRVNMELVKDGAFFIPQFLQDVFEQVGDRHEKSATKIRTPYDDTDFNQRINIYTPGNMLSIINDTMLATDMCTDALQEQLDQGWRIIAVCPQPDQRRPDYILGRYDPTVEPKRSGAKRTPWFAAETDVARSTEADPRD